MPSALVAALIAEIDRTGARLDSLEQVGGLLHIEFSGDDLGPTVAAMAVACTREPATTTRLTRLDRERGTIDVVVAPQQQVRTAVWLPVSLRDQLTNECAGSGARAVDVLLEELRRTDAELAAILSGSRPALGMPAGAPRRRRDGLKGQVWITLDAIDLARFDRVAARWCSNNRSATATRLLVARYARGVVGNRATAQR